MTRFPFHWTGRSFIASLSLSKRTKHNETRDKDGIHVWFVRFQQKGKKKPNIESKNNNVMGRRKKNK